MAVVYLRDYREANSPQKHVSDERHKWVSILTLSERLNRGEKLQYLVATNLWQITISTRDNSNSGVQPGSSVCFHFSHT